MRSCSSRLSSYYCSIVWSSLLVSVISFIVLCAVAGDSARHRLELDSCHRRIAELDKNVCDLQFKVTAIKPFNSSHLDQRITEVTTSIANFNTSLDGLRQCQAEDVAMLTVQIDGLKLWIEDRLASIDAKIAGIGYRLTCLYNAVFRPCCAYYRRR